jgi:hypothetical protein
VEDAIMRMLIQRYRFLALSFTIIILILGIEQLAVGEREIYHLKWSQPPIEINPRLDTPLYCGWDEQSLYTVSSAAGPWTIVADDFRCLGSMPIVAVSWWGSYNDWNGLTAPTNKPIAWRIAFWSNVPADNNINFSRPGSLLWQVKVSADRVYEERAGFDMFPPITFETCFQYYVHFKPDEYFWQNQFIDISGTDLSQHIFWMSITAIYPSVNIPSWGWNTRSRPWMDNAVTFELVADEIQPGMVVDPGVVTPITSSVICGSSEGYDTSFELETDPNYIKWEQPFTGIRNWHNYEDEESMALVDPAGVVQISRIVADDWKCEGNKPVTSIVWWGSYIGYNYQACECESAVDGAMPVSPDYFLLSIWTNVPDPNLNNPQDFSHPGQKIWEYIASEYDEVMVGYDKHPGTMLTAPAGYEPVFRYSVLLPQQNWFCQENETEVFWLSVVAVYKDPQSVNYSWGWTNHEGTTSAANNDAVAGQITVDPTDALETLVWQELYDQTNKSEGMSFVLFTEMEDCNSSLPVTCRPACATICPAIETECPAVETRCPTTQTRCPVVQTRCPGGETYCPPVQTQCPAVSTECPAVSTQCPTVQTECPAETTYCPVVQTQCPSVSTQCPVVITQCPLVETRCPAEETKCPVESTICPAESTSCPAVETQCPVAYTQCPATHTECFIISTQCPPVDTRCPLEKTRCPTETTKCPPVRTRCPTVSTQCPTDETRCPIVETKCPIMQTQCPVINTQCPASSTICPVVSTQCPTEQTRCPYVATQCPVVMTQCPRCIILRDNSLEEPVHFLSAVFCPAIDVKCPTVIPESVIDGSN